MAAGQQQETAVLSVLLNGEQAKNEIAELEKKAEELKEQIKALGKDDKNRKELVRQLQEVKGTVKLLETGVVDVDRVLNNLSTSKPKELNAVLRALKQQLQFSNIERGSAEWNRLQEAIRKVKQELQNVSEESKLAESRMSRMSNGFNKYFGMVTAGIAAITGLSLTFRKLAEDVAKLDDVYADVMKTTGMTKDEVLALNEAFKKMDTRTARGNLNAIAEEGGRIGIAKEEILSFVKAMDIANVALGDSFKGGAEEIANTLGKLKFLFEDTKNMGVEKAYLAIGSAINELGANGVASEVNIAEFAKRLGSMPAALKPTAAEAMALGAAFEESGIEAEVASRSYGIVLKQASVHADKFARIMGASRKEVEEMINANPLDFFLKFSTAMKGLSATDTSKWLKELGINADGANKAIGAAANSTDRFRELQEIAGKAFADGTSVINEFNIKNSTLAAKMDKAREQFHEASLALGQRLNPVLLHSTNAMTYLIKVLPAVIDWFSKYGKIIVNTAIAIGAYSLAVNASVIADKLKVLWTDRLSVSLTRLWAVMKANPYGVLIAAATALYTLYQSMNRQMSVAEQKQRALNDVSLTAQKNTAEQTAGLERLLKIARDETRSKEERLSAIKKLNEISPEHLDNLTLEEISTDRAKIAIDKYRKSLLEAAMAKAAFDKIVELQQQKLELQNKSATEIYEENSSYWQKFWAGMANGFGDSGYFQSVFDRAYQKRQEAIKSIEEQITALSGIASAGGGNDGSENGTDNRDRLPAPPDPDSGKAEKQRKALNGALKELETGHLDEMSRIKKQYLAGEIKTGYEYNQAILNQQDKFDSERKAKIQELLNTVLTDRDVRIEAARQIADIEQKNFDRQIQLSNKLKKILLEADPVEAEKQAYENRLRELGLYGDEATVLTEEQYKAQLLLKKQHGENLYKIDAGGVRERLKELDVEQAAEEAKLAEQHRTGLMTEGAYREELLKLQKEYLNKKLAIPGISGERKDGLDKAVSQNEADASKTKEEERRSAREAYGLIGPKEAREAELKIIEDFEARGVLTHEEAAKAKALIDQQYLESLTGKVKFASDQIQSVTSSLTSAFSSFQEAESSAVSRKYDRQIKAAGKNSRKVEKLEEEKEKELNAIRAKYADKQFAVTIAQVTASTAVTAMEAYKALAGIPVVGPVLGAAAAAAAIAAGAGQIAVAREQRNAAKEGYYTGGFTPAGPLDKPQGVVHSHEFVGNHLAVQNPAIRKIFNVVKEAQDNNTVSSLTEKDFARALDYREAENRHLVAGISSALAPAASGGENESPVLLSIAAWLNRNAEVTDRLNRRLDEPFETVNSVTGKHGIKQALDSYDRTIKYKSRNKNR